MAEQHGVLRLRLSDQVADRIRNDILTGGLRPNARMVQNDWADQLGVSRMPVRDAFLRLQNEGLLTALDNGTAVVTMLSEEDVFDTYAVSAMTAGLAAERSTARMSDAALARLTEVHQQLVGAVKRKEVEAATTANHAFHRLLTVECASTRLIAMIRALEPGTAYWATHDEADWQRRSVNSHGEILKAVQGRDGATAGQLMRVHVAEAAEVVIDRMRRNGYWDVTAGTLA